MFLYEFVVGTAKAKEIASYDTLFYPFDIYIWSFIITLTLLEMAILLTMDYFWKSTTGIHSSRSFTFEGTLFILAAPKFYKL
jgi:hypothetical protein